jgi:hypothetical protein
MSRSLSTYLFVLRDVTIVALAHDEPTAREHVKKRFDRLTIEEALPNDFDETPAIVMADGNVMWRWH